MKRLSSVLLALCASAWLAGSAMSADDAARVAPISASLTDIAWLAGCWQLQGAPAGSVEHWMAAADGVMLGMARTLRTARAPQFEFMQLRATANGSVEFIAHPMGASGTRFALRTRRGDEWVFENLANDFPQRVSYRRVSDSSVHARIEGSADGKIGPIDYQLIRTGCGLAAR